MPYARGTRYPLLFSAGDYSDKVLSYSPIAYWPLWETQGSVAQCLVNSAQDGAYTGLTLGQPGIGDGNVCVLSDGANDYTNIYSTTLRDAFSGAEGTLLLWAKMASGAWTDAAVRHLIYFYKDTSNRIQLNKAGANNQMTWSYTAGGVIESITKSGLTTLDWMVMGLTWSKSAGATGEIRAYFGGTQEGSTQTSLGTWAGVLGVALIGARGASLYVHHGHLAHGAAWDRALTPAQMADLGVV